MAAFHAHGQWTRVADFHAGSVQALAAASGALFAGTDSGLFCSLDSASSWFEADSGIANKNIRALAAQGGVLYAGTWGGGVFRSKDGGAFWTVCNNGLTDTLINALLPAGCAVFAATRGGYTATGPSTGYRGGVFVSSDSGAFWTNALYKDAYMVTSLAFRNDTVAAATNGGGIFFSGDRGVTWLGIEAAGMPTMLVQTVAFFGKYLFAATYDPGCDEEQVIRQDGFASIWTFANFGLTTQDVRCFAESGACLFAGTNGKGVFLSVNAGDNWSDVSAGLADTAVACLAVCGGALFAGTTAGAVWQRPISEMAAAARMRPAHASNFPGAGIRVSCAVSGAVEIFYRVMSGCHVKLEIYTACGKKAAAVLNGWRSAGTYRTRIDGLFIPAGIYLYRLFAGPRIECGRFAKAR